jgi:diguanylate cyclase (GGDEF)-like protein/PAS domain S-box-containing protein
MIAVPHPPEPHTLAEALDLLRQRDSEIHRARQQLAHAHQEIDDTNRGLIALHTELEAARHAEARLAAVVQSSDDAMVSMTPDGVIQTWNPGAERLLGHPESQILLQPAHTLMPSDSQELLTAALQKIRSGERAQPYDTRWCRADGTLVDVSVTVCAIQNTEGELIGFSAVARDITAQVEAQRKLERLAHFDALTGLANRAEAIARLDVALTNPRNPGPHLGLLFCDIDHFKTINDTWGHAAGDDVLTTLAQRIRDCVRQGDTVGRTGGDEMLVLLPGLDSLDQAAQIAEKIRRRAGEPIRHGAQTIHATLSIGATLAVPGESVTTITARADAAMYDAKRAGRNTVTRI